ncbi:uncharacterized protein LOC103782926 isoform X2 [Pan paniscus]|uniref:uncharacterized protein LOC103782926 isoform X2 n=1 Tax=Pan paniscus TaxID=9597 RepID=UPI00156125D2|nr:uncharacterized protein LOC103782926 isoform X2 [Pan paniscus]
MLSNTQGRVRRIMVTRIAVSAAAIMKSAAADTQHESGAFLNSPDPHGHPSRNDPPHLGVLDRGHFAEKRREVTDDNLSNQGLQRVPVWLPRKFIWALNSISVGKCGCRRKDRMQPAAAGGRLVIARGEAA